MPETFCFVRHQFGTLLFFKENEPFKGLMKIEKGADMCGTFRIYYGLGLGGSL